MCGINGIIQLKKQENRDISNLLSKMNSEIFHRGPDEDGFFTQEAGGFQVGMAMRRLSIIDLSTGKQPIYSQDGAICIVFNGEIYNYKILKNKLTEQGVHFETTSDTEVILRLYEKYGIDSFSLLDGMFAFSIYDANLKKVFIARDFFGEKPLYYFDGKENFIWASELKSIIKSLPEKPEISPKGLNLYFRLTYIPAPFTIYRGVKKLEPNHYLEINCEDLSVNNFEITQNFKDEVNPDISFGQASKKTHDLVSESVLSRSMADVPLGTFLSGGVDSSIVSLALAKQKDRKIDTFSIGFEKKSFDETDKSRTVAKLINSNHHEFIISLQDIKENINQILMNFDEPFADSSSLPTYLVANKTRQNVKVALTGDGGDEVFGGYNKYYISKLNQHYTSIIPQELHNNIKGLSNSLFSTSDDKRGKRFKIRRLLNAINYEGDFYYNIISLAFQEQEINRYIKPCIHREGIFNYYKDQVHQKNTSLTDFRRIDKIMSLEGDMLVKVDRTSMLASLESRAPFLNKELWNYTMQLPEEYLMKGWNKKYLLKEAFKDYFPKGFLDKSKKGFGVPVGDWLRSDLKIELKSYIEPQFLNKQNIFNPEEIIGLVEKHLSGKEDNTFRVWTFYCFQKWYQNIYRPITT